MKSSFRVSVAVLSSVVSYWLCVPVVQAETRITDEYIAIDFEAETFESSDDRWVLTDPGTQQTDQDPDPNHSDLASNNAYLELLPDIRVTHADPAFPPTAYWGNPGDGPTLAYEVDFPEAGRYHVHVRALSTGTEDNGIFVGFNDDWPDSGLRLQFCTANQGWRWSSAQRGHEEETACGVEKTIWVTVETPGIHTVKFSAREDGFEFDRVMLIKDKSVNTRVCSPINENEITCADALTDGISDMMLDLQSDRSSGVIGDIVELTANVSNVDGFDDAENVSVVIDSNLGSNWELLDADSRCNAQGTDIVCELATVAPLENGDPIVLPIQLKALTVGAHALSATVSSSNDDSNFANNTDALTVNIEQAIEYTSVKTTGSWSPSTVPVLETVELNLAVANTGDVDLKGTELVLEFAEEIDVSQLPAECTGTGTVLCTLGSVEPGDTTNIKIAVESGVAGSHLTTMTTKADNLEQGSVTALLSLTVEPVDAEPNGDTPSVVTSDSTDDGGALGWFVLLMLVSLMIVRAQMNAAQARSMRLSRIK